MVSYQQSLITLSTGPRRSSHAADKLASDLLTYRKLGFVDKILLQYFLVTQRKVVGAKAKSLLSLVWALVIYDKHDLLEWSHRSNYFRS